LPINQLPRFTISYFVQILLFWARTVNLSAEKDSAKSRNACVKLNRQNFRTGSLLARVVESTEESSYQQKCSSLRGLLNRWTARAIASLATTPQLAYSSVGKFKKKKKYVFLLQNVWRKEIMYTHSAAF
jgi:hypothetical protein